MREQEQWTNETGDLITYLFWYLSPKLETVDVDGMFCPTTFVKKFQCAPATQRKHPGNHSLSLNIDRLEAIGKDYKVFVTPRNTGNIPVLLGLNGEREDGSPELWVLAAEQEEDPGHWDSVDAICAEHPAFDCIVLHPEEDIQSWVLAVDFPESNHRFGMCWRKAAHLHGKIRAEIRYYLDPCEVKDPLDSPVYSSVSDPVSLPAQTN